MSRPDVLVVGCGVAGLTSGVRLLEAGHPVTIVADRLPPETTSDVAAAIWFPYRAYPTERVLDWARTSLGVFREEFYVDADSGVSEIPFVEVLRRPVAQPWWHDAIDEFTRVPADKLPEGYVDGFRILVPRIETPIHMGYLVERFRSLGGRIERVSSPHTELSALGKQAKLIVNCSGLGARQLCNDDATHPIRGQIVRIENPGIREAITDDSDPPTYLVPRRRDCILGGTAERDAWQLEPDMQVAREIVERCARLEPRVREAKILDHRVGLRPGRSSVRLEVETLSNGCSVVHNYGHGGSGFTLGWGCAEEVVERISGFLPETTS